VRQVIRSIPAGWHTITPRIVARDAAGLVEFIKEVFQARGDFRADVPSEIQIGDSRILISGEGPRDVMPAFLYVYVEDADSTTSVRWQPGRCRSKNREIFDMAIGAPW
jgi:hypothetical protein